jgi:hypothetical protein
MKNLQRIFAASLVVTLCVVPSLALSSARRAAAAPSVVQQNTGALERGYRTGYSDGYMAGYRDAANNAARDYRNKEDYQRGDRAYTPTYGAMEDYRDGYQQGFEIGYDDGFERRAFKSDVPSGLSRRQQAGVQDDDNDNNVSTSGNTGGNNGGSVGQTNASSNGNGPVYNGNGSVSNGNGPVSGAGIYSIPSDTVMTVELLTNLSTDATQRGDRFQARVLDPREYEGAIIDGRVTRVKRPGKISGKAELQLAFDHIRFSDNRGANFEAQVIEVIDMGGSEGVGDVDPEGGVKGKDSSKDDVAKVGASTGIGAIIGAIAGGGKGAAIGAAIGGAIGTGGVLTQRGKDVRLPSGQQLRIRTSSTTRIQ